MDPSKAVCVSWLVMLRPTAAGLEANTCMEVIIILHVISTWITDIWLLSHCPGLRLAHNCCRIVNTESENNHGCMAYFNLSPGVQIVDSLVHTVLPLNVLDD